MQRVLFGRPSICTRCQRQALQRLQFPIHQRQFGGAPVLRLPAEAPVEAPKESKDDEPEFVPRPLGRPIGFPDPPKAGENLGTKEKKVYTGKTMSERNLQKRKDIVEKWGTNYFRDFKNIRKYRSGKTFMANRRLFKREAALYFPNFHGESLAESKADTTPVLKGKISVVNVYSSDWGVRQSQTFTGNEANPELQEILKANKDVAQMVDVNVEENALKAWIIAVFKWNLRRQRPKEDWGKYFVIRKGVSEQIREMIGLLNSRVGYVYLLDEQCKIRWAGSADAEGTEKEDMNKGLQKLIEDKKATKTRTSPLWAKEPAKSSLGRESGFGIII